MQPSPLFDSEFSMMFKSENGSVSKVTLLNDPPYHDSKSPKSAMPSPPPEETRSFGSRDLLTAARKDKSVVQKHTLQFKFVTQQTSKGKVHRKSTLVVVGNGNGLVGVGEGKNEDASIARRQAETEAIRNMDYVDRFEQRTIWTNMDLKRGATHIFLRPRPVGFGLRCNPYMHQVLKAAGIKDISAKVWGSRNPMNVVKATLQLIQSGHAPLSMGDGVGGKGRRLDAGCGMRGKESLERERGRKFVDDRTW